VWRWGEIVGISHRGWGKTLLGGAKLVRTKLS
jgi:hypothetical protein